MHKSTAAPPRLILHTIFNYGHFLVYASVFTRWALSKGFEVHILGRGLDGPPIARCFAGTPGVILHDACPGERLSPAQAEWARQGLLKDGLEYLLEAQRTLKPDATVLLTTDDFIFENVAITDARFRFETPTYGLLTFGNREHYTAYADSYAARVDMMVKRRAPFQAIFTLDEHHASDTGADPSYLVFLPDIFAEDVPSSRLPVPTTENGLKLAAFLATGKGPVLPVIGKFDRRKNNLLVLELAASMPDTSCVVLGERVPCQEDARIDDLLDTLRRRGVLFESWGFVPEELFHVTLAHERTALLPLPYSCHYGSSGIQLLGFAHGKPCVVPSNGLMARRVTGHGLGRVFNPGDKTGFDRACREVLELGPSAFTDSCLKFMNSFSESSRGTQLCRAFGLERGEPVELSLNAGRKRDRTSQDLLHEATTLFLSSRHEDALRVLDAVLAKAPDNPLALFRKTVILWLSDRRTEASDALRNLAAKASLEEFDFFVRLASHDASVELSDGCRDLAGQKVLDLLKLIPDSPDDGTDRYTLTAHTWREAGVVLARSGAHEEAARCFRQALKLDPGCHDCRLNLSDVLRYAGRHAESLAEIDILEATAPDWPGVWHKRGQVYHEMGAVEQSLDYFLLEPEDSPHRRAAAEYIRRIRAERT